MKCAYIDTHKTRYPVKVLCGVLGVSRSAWYSWRAQAPRVLPPDELALRGRMRALFRASRDSLGSRTLRGKLQEEGFTVGRAKVRNRMKTLALQVKQKKKYRLTTDSGHQLPVAPNLLNRQFYPTQANQVWGADITYLWTQEGWLYLAVILDLYSRRVVGWSLDRCMTQALVVRALLMAVNLRQPPPGLIHHSDRGSQYAAQAYQALLKQYGMVCSMSRKGNCWDNAPVERFFSSLKREWTGDCWYATRQAAIADVREYVAVYYNAQRLHSTLGYKTPIDYELENGLNQVSGLS